MYGLRNPWRFSFDTKNGDMWIGDVGQDMYEEVDYARAGTGAGANWGWNLREGFHPYNGGAQPAGARDPILERPHTAGDCAIIGGYVYRGSPSVPLDGAYVFGDECTGVHPGRDAERRAGDAGRGPAPQRVGADDVRAGPEGRALRGFARRHDLHDRGRVAHSVGRGQARTEPRARSVTGASRSNTCVPATRAMMSSLPSASSMGAIVTSASCPW